MFKSVISLLLIGVIIITVGCKKQTTRYSYVNLEESYINGGDVKMECYYHFLYFDEFTYGVCWSDTSMIPERDPSYPETESGNFNERTADFRKGNWQFWLNNLPRAQTLRARTYMILDNSEILYSEDYFEFKTTLFHDMGCDPEENMIIIDGEMVPIDILSNGYNGSQFQVYAATSDYSFEISFYNLPITQGYDVVAHNPSSSFDHRVKLVATNNNGCKFSTEQDYSFYVVNFDNEILYLKFCDINAMSTSNNCQPPLNFGGFIKIVL